MVSEAVGEPVLALPLPVAPIAPEPFVPEVSTPAKLITCIDETTLWERFAVTEAFVSVLAANARQISEVPICVFVRWTRAQVRPPPVTLVAVMWDAEASVATSAKTNSFPSEVENMPLVMAVDAVAWSFERNASTATLPGGGGNALVTVRLALLVATYIPEIVTEVGTVTPKVVTGKFAVNCPAGTVTALGTLATDGFVLESVTAIPPLVAG